MTKPTRGFYWLLVAGVVSIAISACAVVDEPEDRSIVIASTLAGVGATTLGFVLTAVTILAALANSRLVGKMYQTGHAQVLFDELFSAVLVFLLITVVSVAYIVAPTAGGIGELGLAITYFLFGTIVLGVAGRKFYNVMLTLGKGPKTNGTGNRQPQPSPQPAGDSVPPPLAKAG